MGRHTHHTFVGYLATIMKLTYWPVSGRALMSRCLLHYKGVEFEDNFQDGATWPEDKKNLAGKLLYPNIPHLEDGDMMLNESVAVLKYLGRKYDLAPKCEAEEILADQFEGFLGDFFAAHGKVTDSAALKAYKEGNAAKWAPMCKHLENNKWCCGENLTWVDFYLFGLVDIVKRYDPEFLTKCPVIKKIEDQLCENECLKKYLATDLPRLPNPPAAESAKL